ncbi:MAG TPA: hypothetical protein VM889_07750 [Candidatus Thermoplasmatota archaeon]|nr:hypothetical protein [Candidatus Thermoplasmatota archaeon]
MRHARRFCGLLTTLLLSGALAGCLAPGEIPGQSPGASQGEGDANPYAHLAARGLALTPEEEKSLREGAGASLALPAELNGYPGPLHVLELGDRLGLSDDQWRGTWELRNRTKADAQAKGAEILALHARIAAMFRDGEMDENRLAEEMAALGLAYGELRYVHLRAHLEQAAMLSKHQRVVYGELRGYGAGDHAGHAHE